MGAGIAQLACRSGARTLLHDPVPDALALGGERIAAELDKLVARGRLDRAAAQAARERLALVGDIGDLADCELVIEAAPERLELKHDLFAALSRVVSDRCVLATNTSSLSVTAIAAAALAPERVVGMHFFNPAPVMRLLEVVAGEDSAGWATQRARATGEAMGKSVIEAADGPGFLVNRCNRPFGLEALRLLGERVAEVPAIDRICRLGGGFRMGPFELMDLVGVDVGFDVSRSFYEQSFGEPRWRPSPITARYVAAGRLGRKSARGFYDYRDGPHRPEDADTPPRGEYAQGSRGELIVAGASTLAGELRELASAAGWKVHESAAQSFSPFLELDCDPRAPRRADAAAAPAARAVLCQSGSLAALCHDGSGAGADGCVGFHALAPLEHVRLVELTRVASSSPLAGERAQAFFASLGWEHEWVGDAPGLVLGRIVCQVINESAFALGEGIGSARDVDTGMVLGLNHPRGPLAWADAIGLDNVLATLDGLWAESREERYRPAPALRAHVLAGRLGARTGGGFFDY
jgi:3-hydroxybutyryl-CoA dehydrogenase